jgi:hypothetical protein
VAQRALVKLHIRSTWTEATAQRIHRYYIGEFRRWQTGQVSNNSLRSHGRGDESLDRQRSISVMRPQQLSGLVLRKVKLVDLFHTSVTSTAHARQPER